MGIEEVVDGKVEEAPVVEAAPIVETPAVEAAPVVDAPAAETPPVAAAPAVEEVKDGQHVPLPTFLDMRDRAIAAEKREAAREAERQQQAPAEVPDPYDDPKGFAAHVERVADAKATDNRFRMSNVYAKREYGEETVNTATEWALERAKSDPVWANQYMREDHPIDWIVRQHKEAADLDDYRKDPAAFARRILETSGQAVPPVAIAPAVVEQQQAPITPPRSIAASPSKNGGVADVPLGPMAALEAVFAR